MNADHAVCVTVAQARSYAGADVSAVGGEARDSQVPAVISSSQRTAVLATSTPDSVG